MMMELSLDPAVIAVLCIIAVGSILTIMAVTTCCVCNKCCRDGKSKCSIYYQPEVLPQRDTDLQNVSIVANRTQNVKDGGSVTTATLKDSVLTRDGPPTYQMATEYPRMYAGQYYIGMSGESGVTPLSSAQNNHLDSRQPPDYHLIAPC